MNEDSHLEMEYEDRFVADTDEDDGSIQVWEIEPDECPVCYTPMGCGHTKDCKVGKGQAYD